MGQAILGEVMSFSYNPLKHIELIETDDGKGCFLYCHGCGWGGERRGVVYSFDDEGFSISTPFQDMKNHVKNSHDRTAKDFETWSKY